MPRDAAPLIAPGDAAPPTASADAAPPPADAGARHRPTERVAVHPHAPPDAGAGTAAPPALRQVTIGSRPWSTFTIDSDPTRHETPETLSLAPGPHRIHFANPEADIDKTITLDVPSDKDVKHVEILVPDNH
jgi:hypothetical protein